MFILRPNFTDFPKWFTNLLQCVDYQEPPRASCFIRCSFIQLHSVPLVSVPSCHESAWCHHHVKLADWNGNERDSTSTSAQKVPQLGTHFVCPARVFTAVITFMQIALQFHGPLFINCRPLTPTLPTLGVSFFRRAPLHGGANKLGWL